MSRENREAIADWLVLAGAVLLFGSLFLTWSHQLTGPLIDLFGRSPLLRGVPRDPTGWQVYSAADIVLALLAVGFVAVAAVGSRGARLAAFGCAFAALVFVVHAIAVPPSNGVEALFDPARSVPRYVPVSPAAGVGETVALVGLGLAVVGLTLSFTAD